MLLVAAVVLIAAISLPGTWHRGPQLPVARSEVAVAAVDGELYVIGGYANGNVDQSLVQVLNPVAEAGGNVTGTWRDVAPLPQGLNHVGAVGFDRKIYTFGGFSAQNNSAVAEADVYDPATNRWSPIAPLPHPLGSVSVAVLAGKIHLVGGRDLHSVGTHLVYNPATNSYAERASLPIGRDHMGLVAFDGRLYAVGGRIDTPAHNTSYVDIYDPKTNSWSAGAPMPTARSGMAVAVYHSMIFAIGGEARGMIEAFRTNEGYDPASNRWSEYAPLPEGRHGTGAAVLNDAAVGAPDKTLYVPAGAAVPGGSHQTNTLLTFSI